MVGTGSLGAKEIPAHIMDKIEELKTRFLNSVEQNRKSSTRRFHYLDILPFREKQACHTGRKSLKCMTPLLTI